jgi:hypothetical protein
MKYFSIRVSKSSASFPKLKGITQFSRVNTLVYNWSNITYLIIFYLPGLHPFLIFENIIMVISHERFEYYLPIFYYGKHSYCGQSIC